MTCMKLLLLSVTLIILALDEIHGHGMLMEPVNRASAWRKGFKMPPDYDDDGCFCGGLLVMIRNKGKCGLCGDDYVDQQPRPHENTGYFGTGTIVKTYKSGQTIDAVVDITANHWGTFTFQLCPLFNSKELETEECFARYPLKLANGSDKYVLKSHKTGYYNMSLLLPEDLTCEHCVLRWTYVAANNWGKCADGTEKVGCGPQETFKTCSDITIQ